MPGITSLIGLKPADDKSIQVFYTKNDHLSLDLKAGTSSGEDSKDSISTRETDLPGNLINDSPLSSAEILGIKIVVGFTRSPKAWDEVQTSDVSLISPVYRSIKKLFPGNTSVAMSSTGQAGFVYFTDGEKYNEIYESNPLDPHIKKLPRVSEVLPNTSLAAYYNPESKNRYVIYQAEKGDFTEYDVSLEQNNPISGTLDSKKKTPIAAVYLSEQKQVFLYYTDNTGSLHKKIKSGKDWKESQELTEAPKAAGQIAVTNSDGVNHLFYYNAETTQIEHFKDAVQA